MLMEVSDSAVEVSQTNGETIISLPKRVQTMEERERTELFAIEVADLLCQSPRCRLPFNKFIPSYHHHFSRQCRVADYGFTKLIDLLEAVPNVVQVSEWVFVMIYYVACCLFGCITDFIMISAGYDQSFLYSCCVTEFFCSKHNLNSVDLLIVLDN